MFLTVWVIIKPASRLQYRILRRLPEKGNWVYW
jgi:hypothetical protein